jgi:hypothetical protein
MPVDGARHFEPTPILAALLRHGVKFVAIGGYAAALRGAPFVTFDVDVTPSEDKQNLSRLSAALKELDARVRTVDAPEGLPFDHDADSLAAARFWNLHTRHGDLDISFVPSGTQGYDDLKRDAEELSIDGLSIVVASLADIVRSKGAANRDKDRRVLPALREILAQESEQRRRGRRTQS